MKLAPTVLFAILLLSACASDRAFHEGERLLAEGRTDEGLKQLELAMREQPSNVQIRAAYLRGKEERIQRLLAQGDTALTEQRLDQAAEAFQQVLKLHPENTRAPAGLAAVEAARRNAPLLREAEQAIKRGEYEAARHKLRVVLAQNPGQAQARALLQQADVQAGKPQGVMAPQLDAKFRRPISLEFRDAPLRSVFDSLSRQSGLNFVLDKDLRTDAKVTIYARDTAILDAVDMLLATSQLNRKVLSGNTLLIYPNTAVKQREYQELVVKSFFLANADAKTTLNLIKTLAKTKDVFVDEKLNMIMVRDTPEAVRLVEKLIAVQDRPEPEVMLEVEILEVKRSKLMELGVQWPNQFGVLNVIDTPVYAQNSLGVPVATGSVTRALSNLPLTVADLSNIDSSRTTLSPSPLINLRKDDGDVNLLANPRIRVKNREKAKIHIGDKVPVITSNVTSTGVTSESVAYLDVGLKLDVEPQVYLEGDVAIKVGMEVSNIVQQVKSATGTLTYQLGSRNANTVLRLKDGETQVLAGLISDEDRSSASKVPGLGDIPLLGRLFSSQRDDKNKTEIVLLITPRILRNVERPELAQGEFFAGTEAETSDQPLQLRPAMPGSLPGFRPRSGRPSVQAPQAEDAVIESLPEPAVPNAPLPVVPPQP